MPSRPRVDTPCVPSNDPCGPRGANPFNQQPGPRGRNQGEEFRRAADRARSQQMRQIRQNRQQQGPSRPVNPMQEVQGQNFGRQLEVARMGRNSIAEMQRDANQHLAQMQQVCGQQQQPGPSRSRCRLAETQRAHEREVGQMQQMNLAANPRCRQQQGPSRGQGGIEEAQRVHQRLVERAQEMQQNEQRQALQQGRDPRRVLQGRRQQDVPTPAIGGGMEGYQPRQLDFGACSAATAPRLWSPSREESSPLPAAEDCDDVDLNAGFMVTPEQSPVRIPKRELPEYDDDECKPVKRCKEEPDC